MASSFSAPYNITISNDSPTITYYPYRDGPVSGGWNLTCANSVESTWIPQSFCVGPSSHHTTYVGASLLVEFEGTAAYLYGQTTGSFVIQVDDQISDSSSGNPSLGLLSKSEGLPFGKHRLFLNVTQAGTISFSEAILTVGVGNANSGTYNLRNRTLVPFTQTSDGLSTLNPQFTYTGTWYSSVPGTIGATGDVVYPRQHTSETGAYMTFNLDQTSAFFIYGLVNLDLGPFSVTLSPPLDSGSPVTTFYNSNAHWISLDRVMYWASGMDRDKEYSVKITNLGQDSTPWWDFAHIDIIDAGSTGSSKGKHGVSAGVIRGAAAGAVVLVLLLLLGHLCYRRYRRSKPTTTKMNISSGDQPPLDYFTPPAAQNVPYKPYGSTPYESTPYESMPAFPGSPGAYNPVQQPLLYAGHPELQSYQPQQFNSVAPPPPPPPAPLPAPRSELSSSRLSYQTSGLVALSWDEAEASSHASVNQKVSKQSGRPLLVQEEDAGSLSPPEENVVRLPPDYKDAWSQGYR